LEGKCPWGSWTLSSSLVLASLPHSTRTGKEYLVSIVQTPPDYGIFNWIIYEWEIEKQEVGNG
jgi:hypothetical protein